MPGAAQQQSVVPVDDHVHVHDDLTNPTSVISDSYQATSPASPSSEFHAA